MTTPAVGTRRAARTPSRSTVDAELPLLRLPMPDRPFRPDNRCSSCRLRRIPAQARGPAPVSWRPGHDEGSLAWFRWLLGHHLAAGVWRLQGELLATARDPQTPRCEAIEAMHAVAAMYHTYSAVLLYSGSCTPEAYATAIRARMIERHPAFSGTWARDHEHVSALLGELGPLTDGTVRRSLRINRRVHISVARRLVPAGKSLLRESGGDPHGVTDADRDHFDEFFRIGRADVCHHSFATQLTQRIRLARDDIADSPVVVDYGNDEVRRLQAEIPALLTKLSATVSGWKGTRS